MKKFSVLFLIILIPLLLLTNSYFSEPTLEETVDFLNNVNNQLFNETDDLGYITFDSKTITRIDGIIHSDSMTGEFIKNVQSSVVTCFASSLSRITEEMYTTLPVRKKGIIIPLITLEFSTSCKNNRNKTKHEYYKLSDSYSNNIDIYYRAWNSDDSDRIRDAIRLWGKLNGAFAKPPSSALDMEQNEVTGSGLTFYIDSKM